MTLTPAKASERLLNRLRQVLEELEETDLEPTPLEARELTDKMKALRATDLATRKAVYKRDRIEEQVAWYLRRGADHNTSAKRWLGVTAAASLLGVVAAFFKIFDAIDFDLLGVFGAGASASIAWSQLNQFRNQATAYKFTAQELKIVRDRIDDVDELDWPSFVSDSEDAISREHTMWLARHGHPGLGSRVGPDD